MDGRSLNHILVDFSSKSHHVALEVRIWVMVRQCCSTVILPLTVRYTDIKGNGSKVSKGRTCFCLLRCYKSDLLPIGALEILTSSTFTFTSAALQTLPGPQPYSVLPPPSSSIRRSALRTRRSDTFFTVPLQRCPASFPEFLVMALQPPPPRQAPWIPRPTITLSPPSARPRTHHGFKRLWHTTIDTNELPQEH